MRPRDTSAYFSALGLDKGASGDVPLQATGAATLVTRGALVSTSLWLATFLFRWSATPLFNSKGNVDFGGLGEQKSQPRFGTTFRARCMVGYVAHLDGSRRASIARSRADLAKTLYRVPRNNLHYIARASFICEKLCRHKSEIASFFFKPLDPWVFSSHRPMYTLSS